jgi:hypothetical protein
MFKVIKTAEDLANEAIKAKQEKDIAEAKQYLSESDWIVTKIAEADIEGLDTTALKAKYIDELSHRKLMREVINSAESE